MVRTTQQSSLFAISLGLENEKASAEITQDLMALLHFFVAPIESK